MVLPALQRAQLPAAGRDPEDARHVGYKEVEGYGGALCRRRPVFRLKELDKNGLTMPTGHFAIDMLENDFDARAEIAKTLGMELIYCPFLMPDQRPDRRRRLARLRRAAGKAAGKPYRTPASSFGWHNHDFEFVPLADGSVPQDRIFEGGPDLGWETDVAWVIRGGADPLQLDRRLRQAHHRRACQGHRAGRRERRTRTAGPMSATAPSTGRG